MAAASSALFSAVVHSPADVVKNRFLGSSPPKPTSHLLRFPRLQRRSSRVRAAVSVSDPRAVDAGRPDDLVASILSKKFKRGKRRLDDDVLEVDVIYCSNPTSPGGGYRSALGRVFFRTKEMIQALEAPDTVRNKVSFCALGFIDGEVSLKGKLKVLDDRWIQVLFEPPKLKMGETEFQYGGESEVKLQITYIDETIRLGQGSRGSLFVFRRRQ